MFAFGVAAGVLVGSLVLMEYGRRLGAKRLAEKAGMAASLSTVEGAVFALMGLLLAFTLSGALQRFDERRQLALQEANAIGTAYIRLNLLPESARTPLRRDFQIYLEHRIELFRLPIDYSISDRREIFSINQKEKIEALKMKLWDHAVSSCGATPDATACILILPAINNAFESAQLRTGINDKHPPTIVYAMLLGLALGAALLAGYGMGITNSRSWPHMLIFSSALAITLYVITDIEFPRLGFVRVDFDHALGDVLARMH